MSTPRTVDRPGHPIDPETMTDGDCAEDTRIASEAERTGDSHSLEEAMAYFRAALHHQVNKHVTAPLPPPMGEEQDRPAATFADSLPCIR